MKEFSLNSADKYKDGTPMMKMPETDINSSYPDKAIKNAAYGKIAEQPNKFGIDFCEADCCPHWEKYCDHTLQDKHMCPYLPHDTDSNLKYLEQAFKEFAKTQDDLIEEYNAVLKIHGDTLEQHAHKINMISDYLDEHLDRICNLENMYENVLEDLCVMRERLCKITSLITDGDKYAHIFENFCGNCTHVNKCRAEDGIYACELSGEIVDPDDSSCSMFEPPF